MKSPVTKDLRGVPPTDLRRILARLEALRDNARPTGVEELSDQARYRLRPGDYRIIHEVDDARAVVEVVKIAHRRKGYRSP